MPNAAVRANAQALPKATNRRGVLAAALAAGVSAALPAASAAQSPVLSTIDRRVLDLWNRRAKLKAIQSRLDKQCDDALDQMPAWTRHGPKFLTPDGDPVPGKDEISAWPLVADLRSRIMCSRGVVNARPSPADIEYEFDFARILRFSDKEAHSYRASALAELNDRLRQRKAEEDRIGLTLLEERSEAAINAICATNAALEEHIETSTLALAASLMILDCTPEPVEGLYRAALAAIRPQLVGPIAEAADRALAEDEESA